MNSNKSGNNTSLRGINGLKILLASIFGQKKKNVKTTPKKDIKNANPYLSTAKAWNSYHQELLAGKRMWQFVALFALMIVFASNAGILFIGMQSKFIPYIVEVDKLGQAVAVGPAERTGKVDERIIHAQLGSFIHDLRLVTPDSTLQTKAIHNIYSMLSTKDSALEKVNEWYTNEAPFKRAENVAVSVSISSIIPQSPDTWQIDWIETVRERSGKLIGRNNMRALATVYIVPTTKELSADQIRKNPTGLFISDISWTKQVN